MFCSDNKHDDQVLIDSGLHSDSNGKVVESPLTINIGTRSARWKNLRAARITRMNASFAQLKPGLTEASDKMVCANVSSSSATPAGRKRKSWTQVEDLELVVAEERYGEGSLENVFASKLNLDRTTMQITQRLAILQKCHAKLNSGGKLSAAYFTERQLAKFRGMQLSDSSSRNYKFNNSSDNSQANVKKPVSILVAHSLKLAFDISLASSIGGGLMKSPLSRPVCTCPALKKDCSLNTQYASSISKQKKVEILLQDHLQIQENGVPVSRERPRKQAEEAKEALPKQGAELSVVQSRIASLRLEVPEK